MQLVARLSVGGMFWLLLGCSDVQNGTTHSSTGANSVGGTSGKASISDSNSSPESVVGSIATSGGTTSATAVAGDALGGGTAISLGGNAGAPEAPGTGGFGQVGAGGATSVSSSGAAGQSAGASETLAQVMARFCALTDVVQCTPNCLAERQDEAAIFPRCRELYRLLMVCQVALPVGLRACDSATVVSPSRCTSEEATYWACVTDSGG